ncbi:hypothetical protein GCM10011614_22770 [Novosphingobium colocasiae]|uniref:Uncharacterized protein n=1 Tax=Novosphingobium colocasiae TaxID=1256513 RepID=A0A918PHW0_9SPHN|nr:hypothetical protein GCM10011614_22770 [Novosphingobium colocasiae]
MPGLMVVHVARNVVRRGMASAKGEEQEGCRAKDLAHALAIGARDGGDKPLEVAPRQAQPST